MRWTDDCSVDASNPQWPTNNTLFILVIAGHGTLCVWRIEVIQLNVYLAGEIHSDWRDQIAEGVKAAQLNVTLTGPVTDHSASDDCGTAILGAEDDNFWKDHKGAKVNALRTRTMIKRADVVVVRFGDQYKQWNAAFDAGYAAALGKPLITLHDPSLTHPLKALNAAR
jgi:YtoQ family protein